jgi:hypothetical protein
MKTRFAAKSAPSRLMFTGLGSIIGSGGCSAPGAPPSSRVPGAVYAWIIGAVVIMFVAVTYAELGAMFPESGGAVRYGHYSHGSLVGFVAGWAAWIAIVSVIPVEAEASVQYMSSWPWDWAQRSMCMPQRPGRADACRACDLRRAGGGVFSAEFLEREGIRRHQQRHHLLQAHRARRHGHRADVHRLSLGELSGRHPRRPAHRQRGRHPHRGGHQRHRVQLQRLSKPGEPGGRGAQSGRSMPIAIFGSLVLEHRGVHPAAGRVPRQRVPPEHLHEGWAALEYSSPFAQLALALNLNWLALLLYADAFVSPSGTGTTYTATTARMIYAMERSGTLPAILGRSIRASAYPGPRCGSIWSVSFIFLFFFRGWGKLAAVISVATIITYLVVPVSVGVLRRTAPALTRPLRIPGIEVLSRRGLHARHADAVLGALAAHRRDHAAVDRAAAGVSLLSGKGRLAGFSPAAAGRLVVDRLSVGGYRAVLGRKQGIRRPRLHRLWLGSALRRDRRAGLSTSGGCAAAGARRPPPMAERCSRRRAPPGPR